MKTENPYTRRSRTAFRVLVVVFIVAFHDAPLYDPFTALLLFVAFPAYILIPKFRRVREPQLAH